MLFNEYPDNFFAILHCRYQSLYADVLLRLYNLFYGTDAISQPSKEEVKGVIASTVEQKGITEWEDELKGDDREREELNFDEIQYRAHLIYRRLIQCGWLEEERDNNFNDIVSIPYYAATLLTVLRDASLGRRVSYGGYVGNVYLQINHLMNNPHEASFLKEARHDSEELLKKLQELYQSIKTFVRQAKEKEGISDILSHFFGNYMKDFFSSAYGKVKTIDNPFKYRYRIQEMLLEIRHDKELLKKIAESYNGERERLHEVIEDIDAIYSIFSRLDDQIALIDSKRQQYETIVREQVKYFDSWHGDIKTHIANILKVIKTATNNKSKLAHSSQLMADNNFLASMRNALSTIKDISFIDNESLSAPKGIKKALKPRRIINHELPTEEYMIEKLKSLRRMASSVGRRDIVDFINHMLQDGPEILGSAMTVNTIKELTCMLLSKYIAYNEPSFRVDELGKEAENRYLVFEEFRIGKNFYERTK